MVALLAGATGCQPALPTTNCDDTSPCPQGYVCDEVLRVCLKAEAEVDDAATALVDAGFADGVADAQAPDVSSPTDLSPPDVLPLFDLSLPDVSLPDLSTPDVPPADSSAAPDLPPADAGQPSTVTLLFAGNDHNCVALTRGDLKCWGRNDYGQLGLGDREHRGDDPGELGRDLPSVDIGSASTGGLRVGGDHNCLYSSSSCRCWGRNDHGQLGLGDRDHRGDDLNEMGQNLQGAGIGSVAGDAVVALELGGAHTCLRQLYAAPRCWGFGAFGQLGRGSTEDLIAPPSSGMFLGTSVATASLYAGGDQTCIKGGVVVDGLFKCFGRNDYGQLGLGDREHRGDDPDEMGDALPALDLGVPNAEVLRLYPGPGHACARLGGGAIKCWGDNRAGQLGLGDTEDRGDEPGEMGTALPPVAHGSPSPPTELALGGGFTCARFEDGKVKCWGENSLGQLGIGSRDNRGDSPGTSVASVPFVELGTGRTATRIVAGRAHVCVKLDDETVKCWGDNSYGQLGRGDTDNRGDDSGEMGDALPGIDLWR